MINKILQIALLTAIVTHATYSFAFGGLLEKLNDAIVGAIVSSTNPEIPSPQQKDRLLNVVDQSKLKVPSTEKVILGSKAYKLAIVKSLNVDEQIKAYQKQVDRFNKNINQYATNPEPFLAEYKTVMLGEVMLERATGILKLKFASVSEAATVQEAFDKGADYIGILDIKLEFTDLSSKTEPGPLTERNITDLSVLFIDKNYEASPDIVVKNTGEETYQPNGADRNIRNSLDILKRARDKTFKEFEAKLNKLVIAEVDDPPVKGLTLQLGGVTEEVVTPAEIPKKKSKKKN